MAIPSFPRYSASGQDRTKKVLEIERMQGTRAKFHVYYTINGVLHIHASWAKNKETASTNMAETINVVHRGAKYVLIGIITLDRSVGIRE